MWTRKICNVGPYSKGLRFPNGFATLFNVSIGDTLHLHLVPNTHKIELSKVDHTLSEGTVKVRDVLGHKDKTTLGITISKDALEHLGNPDKVIVSGDLTGVITIQRVC